jgi:hypothetical protein
MGEFTIFIRLPFDTTNTTHTPEQVMAKIDQMLKLSKFPFVYELILKDENTIDPSEDENNG